MSVYLAAGYGVFWLFTFVFLLSIWSRQRKIQREIENLEEQMARRPRAADHGEGS